MLNKENIMTNKNAYIEDNLAELSTRIGLLVKQYNLLAESSGDKDIVDRLILVIGSESDSGPAKDSDKPKDISDLVSDYNYSQGWSSSSPSCY